MKISLIKAKGRSKVDFDFTEKLCTYQKDFSFCVFDFTEKCQLGILFSNFISYLFRYLLSHFATLIQLQKLNELPEDRSLLHSPFMKSLVAASEIFQLENVFKSSEVLSVNHKSGQMIDIPAPRHVWQWMISAVLAIRELNNLNKDPTWLEQSAQLMRWASEVPLDWQPDGPCQVVWQN